MGTKPAAAHPVSAPSQDIDGLLTRYGCGPIRFAGTRNALYERHLLFDKAIDPTAATPRDQFEAFAHSVRDVLSQRWVLTEKTYERRNPKRVYYLSMEFLIGRSLTNNIMNLRLDPLMKQDKPETDRDFAGSPDEEAYWVLRTSGLGHLPACFIESAATRQLLAMSYGRRYEYGIFK